MSSQEATRLRVRLVTCGLCRGSGWIVRDVEKPAERCPRCGGKGKNEKATQQSLVAKV